MSYFFNGSWFGKGLFNFELAGGESYVSPFLMYDPVAVWDAAIGTTPPGGTTCSALADQTGHGYTLVQPGDASIQPEVGNDGYPYLYFNGAQYMYADAVAALFSGDHKPITVIAAVDHVVRDDALTHSLYMMARNAANPYHYCRLETGGGIYSINYRYGQSNCTRNTTGRTSGIVVDRFTGTARSLWWGTGPTTAAQSGDGFTFTQFTVGAGRTTTIGSQLKAYFRGMAVYDFALSDDQVAERRSHLLRNMDIN